MKNYVIDFLKTLPKAKNIPILIYFLINVAIMVFGNMTVLYITLGDKFMNMGSVLSGLLVGCMSLVMFAVGIVIAFSPVGDFFLRIKNDCENIEDHPEEERIRALFDEVLEKAREKSPSISKKIKIFIKEDDEINAFALGRKTICITTALLDCSDEEIKSIIAHELGHIVNHDTDLLQVIGVSNVYVTIFMGAVWLVLMFYKVSFKAVFWIMAVMCGSFGEAIVTFLTRIFIDFVITAITAVFTFSWKALGNLLIKASMKKNEYEADRFVCELGYGDAFTDMLEDMEYEEKNRPFFKKIAAFVSSNHPSASARLRNIAKNS